MSYSDPEKQKEYQRNWAKDRRESVITWDQLQESDFRDLKTWNDCLEKAKACTVRINGQRMQIAAYAERACFIRHGGDQRTSHARDWIQPQSIVAFAKDLGIHHKTLNTWILVKQRVYDRLSEAEQKKGILYSPAMDAMTAVNQGKAKDHVKEYHKNLRKSPARKCAERCIEYARTFDRNLAEHGPSMFEDEERTEIVARLGKVLQILKMHTLAVGRKK